MRFMTIVKYVDGEAEIRQIVEASHLAPGSAPP
jgi:hypothetical protein